MAQVTLLKFDTDSGLPRGIDTSADDVTVNSLTAPSTNGVTIDSSGITVPTGKVISIADSPSSGTDAVNKDYVTTYVQGLDPQESVLDKDLTSAPGVPSTGDRYILAETGTLAITGVNTGTKTFNVAGDQTSLFAASDVFNISGSTGNDGWYTVVSATYTTDTAIVVSETVPDATVDGNIKYGPTGDTWATVGPEKIVQYNGSSWDVTTPTTGFTTFVEDEDKTYIYNSSKNWVTLGSTSNHNNLLGLQGGTTGEYYHMTSAEDTWLATVVADISATNVADLSDDESVTGEWDFSSGGITLPNSSSNYTSPSEGNTYWDGTADILYVYDGSAWEAINQGGSAEDISNPYTAGAGGIAQYDVVYISAADTVLPARADAWSTARPIGYAPAAIAESASGQIVSDGIAEGILGGTGTAGAPYYLSASSAGDVTSTRPSNSGDFIILIGFGRNTQDLALNISFIGRAA